MFINFKGGIIVNNEDQITNPDFTKRTPNEWAKIYGIKLTENIVGLWDEYEWAWNFPALSYLPEKKLSNGFYDFDSITEKETRASFLRRDLFVNADIGEKNILKERYIQTAWVRMNINRI